MKKYFNLILKTKGNVTITNSIDIENYLKPLGARGLTYACLCDPLKPEGPFIQVITTSFKKQYKIEYKNFHDDLYVSEKEDFSKFDVIKIFIA